MKYIKYIFGLILFFFIVILVPVTVNADMGPKPNVTVKIVGIGDRPYTATLISKEADGPNFTYEDYLEYGYDIDYHPIMQYEDSEGYKWVGRHWDMYGDGEFHWGYYPPDNFKILIRTSSGKYYTTEALDQYAFSTYYKVNFSSAIETESEPTKLMTEVINNYNYFKEIITFIIRMAFTLAIEIGLAYLFGFRDKNHLKVILIVNIITQVLLNGILNIGTYFYGQFGALFFFIIVELLVFIFEIVFYCCYFKGQRSKAILYGLAANLLSFGAGFGLYILEQWILM